MIEHNKNFYSLEELERTRDSLKGYLDNEEVYYFVGAIRYACDEIERLNNIINELDTWLKEKVDSFKEDEYVSTNIEHERLAIKMVYYYLQELKGAIENI